MIFSAKVRGHCSFIVELAQSPSDNLELESRSVIEVLRSTGRSDTVSCANLYPSGSFT